MKAIFRQSFYLGLAGLFLSTGNSGQQSEPHGEQRQQPPGAWKTITRKKVALPAGTMLAVRLIDRVSSDKNPDG